jgi:hypothetical protein
MINKTDVGPMRLYVGSLHFNITEEMLKGIFEPFGNIQSIQLMTDQVSYFDFSPDRSVWIIHKFQYLHTLHLKFGNA